MLKLFINIFVPCAVAGERFLGLSKDWEESVKKREGYSKEEMKRMTLSQETLQGLRMTGKC